MSDRRILWAIAFLLLMPVSASAQGQTPSAALQPAPASADKQLSQGELEALVAPIALYPDSLMSLVLMASTYPLEVVQADRLITEKKLTGDQLKAAVDKQSWDDSVKSLSATPSVLAMMSAKLDWTQKLGDAVLAQQEDVMDAIQRLRARAQANDKLKSTKEQVVSVKQVNDKPVVVIEQADPATVYVPQYDPAVAYGAWPYESYPPYYFPEYGYGYGYGGALLATGLAFGSGYALGRWVSGGNWWGGGANWGNRNLIVNRPIDINNIGNNWQHRPEHRHGVRYSNANVQQKFGNNDVRAGSGSRQDFRGREGRPAGDRANVGNRDRVGAGNAKADRGDRQKAAGGAGKRDGARQAKGGGAGKARAASSGGARAASSGGARAAQRPAAGPRRDAAFGGVGNGGVARANAARGHASLASMGGGRSFAGAGGFRGGGMAMGGGGFRGGGGGGFRGGGGGRRSDIRLKQDIVLLGHLDNGIGFYRFNYKGEQTSYVGVMAQEVERTMPHLVSRGRDGFLRVLYGPLGIKFQTYDGWMKSGATSSPCGIQQDLRGRACVLEQRSEP